MKVPEKRGALVRWGAFTCHDLQEGSDFLGVFASVGVLDVGSPAPLADTGQLCECPG